MQNNFIKRPQQIKNRNIRLLEINPQLRLQQFCNQGLYKNIFTWDKFNNGIMCQCDIFYKINNKLTTIISRSYFSHGLDVEFAKNRVAAIILNEIGLGVEENEEKENDGEKENDNEGENENGNNENSDSEDKMMFIAESGLQIATKILKDCLKKNEDT